MHALIASARSPALLGGTNQPVSPGNTSSEMPAICVAMTGRRRDIASIMTTGKFSAKLGVTSARAAKISSRTAGPLSQPVMRTKAELAIANKLLEFGPRRRRQPTPARKIGSPRPISQRPR